MSNARAVIRDIDKRAIAVLHAYRTWRSPKTAAKRQADYERHCRVQAANIKARDERIKAARS